MIVDIVGREKEKKKKKKKYCDGTVILFVMVPWVEVEAPHSNSTATELS